MTPRGSPRRLWAGSRPRGPRSTRAGPSRGLEGRQYAYWWVDGIHTTLRESDDPKLCLLVIIGVRPDGTKEWVAISDGLRECTESWLDGLRDIKARGLQAGPRLAVGDGALGFWGALDQVYPETVHQRCWFHKMGNVLNALPKSLQGKAWVIGNVPRNRDRRPICRIGPSLIPRHEG